MNTILLVEDEPELRALLGLALRRNGYHVIEADSGVTGFELARRHCPDLILSDIDMAGGDGLTLLRAIRRDPELKTRQVVLMTGTTDLVTARNGMEAGADDFLVKPISLQELLSCVKARFTRASVRWRVEGQLPPAQVHSSMPYRDADDRWSSNPPRPDENEFGYKNHRGGTWYPDEAGKEI